jgi:hypothetical protein
MLLGAAGCGERDEPSSSAGDADRPSRAFGEDVDPTAEVALTPETVRALRTVEDRLDELDPEELSARVERETARVREKLQLAGGAGDKVSIADMFKLQMQMNHLSQLSEMSTSIVSASNQAISAMVRNIRG